MQQIRRLAALSIQRDCFVAAGCIFCLMFALFPFADVALRTGAVMTALLALALMISAKLMPERNYRQTEIWRSLERNPGIPEALAGRVINEILARRVSAPRRICGLGRRRPVGGRHPARLQLGGSAQAFGRASRIVAAVRRARSSIARR